jgi:mRNA interferase RelE/StbE
VSYEIIIARSAQKDMADLHPDARAEVDRHILALGETPRPPGVVFLKGSHRGYLRVRAGDYCVIYAVDDKTQTVAIVAVGPRGTVYKRL